MSIPRFSSIFATRKCKTNNTTSDSFANITADVQSFTEEKNRPEKSGKDSSVLNIRKRSVFVEEGLAWGNWQEATR